MIDPNTAAGTRKPLKKSMDERMYSSDWEPPLIEMTASSIRLLAFAEGPTFVGVTADSSDADGALNVMAVHYLET